MTTKNPHPYFDASELLYQVAVRMTRCSKNGQLILLCEHRGSINWKEFESPYWSPERGKCYDVVLSKWRQDVTSWDDGKTSKPVIVFDVLKVDEEEFNPPKQFSTGAVSFASQIRTVIERAEREGKLAVLVYLEYTDEKRYIIRDLSKYRGENEPPRP